MYRGGAGYIKVCKGGEDITAVRVYTPVRLQRGFAALLLAAVVLAAYASTLAAPRSLEVVGSAWVLAPAVSETPEGMVGVTSNISVVVTRGWGDVYVSTFSLTEKDFQGAAATAARIAARLAGVNFSRYNFYFEVRGGAVIVGGPSAGVAMTVAAYAALTGRGINRSVAVTGMVAPDGSVGPVGGIYEKAWAASRAGVKLFLVPPGQSVVVEYRRVARRAGPFVFYQVVPVKVNLSRYAPEHWGLHVVEVATVRDAVRYMTGAEAPGPRPREPVLGVEARERVSTVRGLLERRALGEIEEASSRLGSARLPAVLSARLRRLLHSYGSSELEQAAGLPPYSVARLYAAERALAAARWVSLLLDYYGGGNLSSRLAALTSRWNATAAALEKTGARGLLDAETQVIAADALVQAGRELEKARDVWSSDPEESLRHLAIASVLVDEADSWAGLLGQGSPRARDEAAVYLIAARSTWPYVGTVAQEAGVGGGGLLDEAEAYYALAARLYAEGYYLLSAAAASRSLALSQAAMDLVQLALSGQPVYLEYSLRLALSACGPEAVASVYFYNLSQLYTGYGDKLVLYKLASQAGELSSALAGVTGNMSTATPQAQREAPAPQMPRVETHSLREYLERALRLLEEKGYLQLALPALVLLAVLLVVARLTSRRREAASAGAGGGGS